jgi:hypothetical protein
MDELFAYKKVEGVHAAFSYGNSWKAEKKIVR